jgi:hypothetical protein
MQFLNDPTVILLSTFIAFLVPPIVSFFKAQNAPSWVPATLFFIVCILGAGLAYIVADETLGRDMGATPAEKARYWALVFINVVTMGRIWYTTFWKPTGADANLSATGPQLGER